jgi:HK97 family phage major capsid protein
MDKSIQDLRERRAVLAKESKKLLDDHTGEKWTKAIGEQVDAKYAAIDAIDDQISRRTKQLELEAETTENEQIMNAALRHAPKDDGSPRAKAHVIFHKWLRGGDEALSAEDHTFIRNTMSTTTGSEGGFTVPSLIAATLYDAMKAYGAMRIVSDVIRTEDGKPLSFPTSDGTAEIGEWIAQNTTATALDASFGTAPLNVFKASSKIVAVPFELLQDSVIDMEGFVRSRLAQRLGRLGNTAFTVGTGTTQPDGVVPKASAGKVGTTGQTLTIIYDDVVDLVHAVDPAYRATGCSFMTNDSLLKVLRKIKDTAGRPIWIPSYDQGIRFGANNENKTSQGEGGYTDQTTAVIFDYLLGYPVWVNNDLAVPAANAKTMLFGNYKYYKIRDAMDVTMFRFTDSAYAKLGQVGFLAWCRMGGNLIDTNAVKYYQHSAT